MSDKVDDGIEAARMLVRGGGRPDVSSVVDTTFPDDPPTEQFPIDDEVTPPAAVPVEGTRWSRSPTPVPLPGTTDISVDRATGGRVSQITAAVDLLITVVERLRDEGRAGREATLTEIRSLLVRHDMLRETVQNQGGRLDSLDETVLEISSQRTAIRILLVVTPSIFAVAIFTLLGVIALVLR